MWLESPAVLNLEVSVLISWNIFAQMFVFAVVGFSKCKSYLNEREKCSGRQIYACNPHTIVKKCVLRMS